MSVNLPKAQGLNIELYMQSGIVESYALKLATPWETAEFEQLLPHYPELREALSEFEYHLELSCIDQEIAPPPDIKKKIEARLRKIGAPDYLPIESSSSSKVVDKSWKTWCIIFFIVGKIFLGFLIYYYIQYRLDQKQIQQLEEQLGRTDGATKAAVP